LEEDAGVEISQTVEGSLTKSFALELVAQIPEQRLRHLTHAMIEVPVGGAREDRVDRNVIVL
jgi:hypothetical protein